MGGTLVNKKLHRIKMKRNSPATGIARPACLTSIWRENYRNVSYRVETIRFRSDF